MQTAKNLPSSLFTSSVLIHMDKFNSMPFGVFLDFAISALNEMGVRTIRNNPLSKGNINALPNNQNGLDYGFITNPDSFGLNSIVISCEPKTEDSDAEIFVISINETQQGYMFLIRVADIIARSVIQAKDYNFFQAILKPNSLDESLLLVCPLNEKDYAVFEKRINDTLSPRSQIITEEYSDSAMFLINKHKKMFVVENVQLDLQELKANEIEVFSNIWEMYAKAVKQQGLIHVEEVANCETSLNVIGDRILECTHAYSYEPTFDEDEEIKVTLENIIQYIANSECL